MKKASFLLVGVVLALSGCATRPAVPNIPDNHIQLFLNSAPQGATVHLEGRVVGVTPVRLNFGPLTPAIYSQKFMQTKPLTLTWKSGAQLVDQVRVTLNPSKTSDFANITLQRPAVDGIAQDEAYAAQLVQDRQQVQRNQQARVEQERGIQNARNADAVISIFGAILGGAAAYQSGKTADAGTMYRENPPSSVTCRTREVGWQLVTKCE